jgi:hypothetical protein
MSRPGDNGDDVATLGSARRDEFGGPITAVLPCLTCRVAGTATFSAVSLYLARELLLLERSAPTRLHRAVLGAGAAGFAGLAVARWRAD